MRMIHFMKLNPAPFKTVKSGKKTIEMRLYDEKRRELRVGDEICFLCIGTEEKLLCKVEALFVYASFEELYAHHDKVSIGYGKEELANPVDMLAYYTEEEIFQYGVVAIQIKGN